MPHQPERIPLPLLFGAAAMVSLSVVGVGVSQLTDIGRQLEPEQHIVASAKVVFADESDGGVGVYEFESGQTITIFPPETGGFVRTAMRAVAHERKVSGGSADAPFEIARTEKGRLLLTDTVTGKTIGLEAFGDINAGDFAQLLGNEDGDA